MQKIVKWERRSPRRPWLRPWELATAESTTYLIDCSSAARLPSGSIHCDWSLPSTKASGDIRCPFPAGLQEYSRPDAQSLYICLRLHSAAETTRQNMVSVCRTQCRQRCAVYTSLGGYAIYERNTGNTSYRRQSSVSWYGPLSATAINFWQNYKSSELLRIVRLDH